MANDFSGDPNCVALWKLDNNANDGKGGNDLTPVNSPAYSSSDKKEGTHSLDLERGSQQYLYRADADLDSGFPGKAGGGASSISVCFHIKLESYALYGVVEKAASASERCIQCRVDSDGYPNFRIGYDGGSTSLLFDTVLTPGKWYHILFVYDVSDNSMKIRVWDDEAGDWLDDDKEGYAGGALFPNDSPFEIGRYLTNNAYTFDGKLDEVVIFKDVITDSEHAQIIAGTYGAGVTEKESADTGAGLEALISRLLASGESGGAVEAADVEGEGQLKDISTSQPAEGRDRLVAKIEMPIKGGGLRL